MKKYKVSVAYMDNYTVEKYDDDKPIGDEILSYYELDGYTSCLDSEGYIRIPSDDREMNFTEFMGYCKSGAIKCDKQLLGMLDVFGEEIYENYYDLLQHQILEPVGYELIIKKRVAWD